MSRWHGRLSGPLLRDGDGRDREALDRRVSRRNGFVRAAPAVQADANWHHREQRSKSYGLNALTSASIGGRFPCTKLAAIRPASGPAVNPSHGKKTMWKPGTPGHSPRIGRQSSVPFTTPAHERTTCTLASDGTTSIATARFLASESALIAGRCFGSSDAGQPPPISTVP